MVSFLALSFSMCEGNGGASRPRIIVNDGDTTSENSSSSASSGTSRRKRILKNQVNAITFFLGVVTSTDVRPITQPATFELNLQKPQQSLI